MTTIDIPRTDSLRAFNRFVTRRAGALGGGLLGTTHPLAEARVLYELAQQHVLEVSDLRKRLDLDSGQLSRLLQRLEGEGLVSRHPSQHDKRRRTVRLTGPGRESAAVLDERSTAEAASVLAALTEPEQRRLVSSMDAVRHLLQGRVGGRALVLRAPGPGDFGWIVERHGARYAAEYGWDQTFEALVARIVAQHAEAADPRREAAWIAELDGRRAGCVLCVSEDARTAKVRLLLVEPWARGSGIGARLVEECLRFARRRGYERITLWTNDVLVAARHIYEAAGFRLVSEEPHQSFGADLVGQYWELDLATGSDGIASDSA